MGADREALGIRPRTGGEAGRQDGASGEEPRRTGRADAGEAGSGQQRAVPEPVLLETSDG